MPKKDGFADVKKDAEKARKKLNETKKAEAKIAAQASLEEADSERAAPLKATNGGKLTQSNGTFSKAAAKAAHEEEEAEGADDYDYDGDEVTAATASTSAPSKAKKESKADLKKQAAMNKKDEFALLAESEKLAKKQRIKDRFLRFLLVGLIMDFFGGGANGSNGHSNGSDSRKKPPQPAKEKKAKKIASSGESVFTGSFIKEKLDLYSGPFMALVVVMAVMYGKAMEDSYSGGRNMEETNFYDVMGLPRDATVIEVRKKYKSLALTWHPDKNPDCEVCPEKFAAISKAYDTLSNVEMKKAYDNRRVSASSLSSMVSVDLTAEDFEAKVLRSNEVWIVEVYDPNDGNSQSFHPIWEETSNNYQNNARFGRLDLSTQKHALKFFPQRIAITPVVFRFARGEDTDNWLWQGSEEQGGASLMRWVSDSYPQLPKVEGADELTRWWKRSHRSRLLITGNGGVIRRGPQNKQFFPVVREAHLWADNFAVTAADAKDATGALEAFGVELPGPEKKKGHPWSIVYVPAGETKEKVQIASTSDLKELPSKIEEVIQKALSTEAPYLTVRNHRQLCGAGRASRTFCLVLVDMPDSAQVAKVVQEVATSRAEYAKELAEMRESEEGGSEEEPFRIQAVRVMTGTSRFPSQPVAVSRDFYTAWAEVAREPMFLVELETQRVSAVKASVVGGLYQQIAYEDQKFKELPEDFHLARALPDPEVPLRRVLFRALTTPFGALFAFVAFAAVAAVAPELELVTNAVGGAAVLVLVLVAWPLACRRFLSYFVGGV